MYFNVFYRKCRYVIFLTSIFLSLFLSVCVGNRFIFGGDYTVLAAETDRLFLLITTEGMAQDTVVEKIDACYGVSQVSDIDILYSDNESGSGFACYEVTVEIESGVGRLKTFAAIKNAGIFKDVCQDATMYVDASNPNANNPNASNSNAGNPNANTSNANNPKAGNPNTSDVDTDNLNTSKTTEAVDSYDIDTSKDSYLKDQWYINAVDANKAWEETGGKAGKEMFPMTKTRTIIIQQKRKKRGRGSVRVFPLPGRGRERGGGCAIFRQTPAFVTLS